MKRTLKTVAVFTLAGFVVSSCASLNKMKKMESDIAYKVTPEVLEAKGGQVDWLLLLFQAGGKRNR